MPAATCSVLAGKPARVGALAIGPSRFGCGAAEPQHCHTYAGGECELGNVGVRIRSAQPTGSWSQMLTSPRSLCKQGSMRIALLDQYRDLADFRLPFPRPRLVH